MGKQVSWLAMSRERILRIREIGTDLETEGKALEMDTLLQWFSVMAAHRSQPVIGRARI